MNKFILNNADTDAIMISKPNGSKWSEKEQKDFLSALNAQFSEKIRFEHDGIYDDVVVIKSKNYALRQGEKIKYKGSGLTDTKKEPAMLEFIQTSIKSLMDGKRDLKDLYLKYTKEASNIQDIKRWAAKKTITKAIFESDRANEEKVRVALEGQHIQEGDKVWLYTAKPVLIPSIVKGVPQYYKDGRPKMREDSPLKLIEKWTPGDEDRLHYVHRVHSTLTILKNLVTMDEYVKYHLKSNKELLERL